MLKCLISIILQFAVIAFIQCYLELDNEYNQTCTLPEGIEGTCTDTASCADPPEEIKKRSPCYISEIEVLFCCENEPDKYKVIDIIAHGTLAEDDEFPFMVALGWPLYGLPGFDYKNGGVLIASNYVLTAAHCTNLSGIEPVVVLPGGVNIADTMAQVYNISKIIVHPKYDSRMAYHDIALIQLDGDIKNYPPICFLRNNTDAENNNVTILGYGQTQFAGPISEDLLKAEIQLISKEQCEEFYKEDPLIPNGLIDTQFCAEDSENLRDTCQGDSGGPVVKFVSEDYNGLVPYMLGITSFGQACARQSPGVYTRALQYIDWIEKTISPAQIC